MWISLGKILFQELDLLLLDEFINYLDLEIIEWLEIYFKGLKIFMVIIFYDWEFFDWFCIKIVEMEWGIFIIYLGNYFSYLVQKEEGNFVLVSVYEY